MKYTTGSCAKVSPGTMVDVPWSDFVGIMEAMAAEPFDGRTPEKKAMREWLAPFQLHDGATSRTKPNLSGFAEFIAVDLDEQGWAYDRIEERLNTFSAIIHSTTKSKPDYQRWRVILQLDRSYSVKEHRSIWSFVNTIFDTECDPKTYDPTRLSFAPAAWVGAHNEFHAFQGSPASVDVMVEAFPPIIEPEPLAVPRRASVGMVKAPDGTDIFTHGMAHTFRTSPKGGRFFKMLCSAAKRFRANGWDLTATELHAAAILAVGNHDHDSEREAVKAIEWAATHVMPETPMVRMKKRIQWEEERKQLRLPANALGDALARIRSACDQ